MKLPDIVSKEMWAKGKAHGYLCDADKAIIEAIVRDCAKVCAEMSNSFYKDRETECAQAILARYGLTEESGE